jgi:TonB family protein
MLSVILSLLLRSGAVLFAAEILRRWLRRSPARQRHGLLLFAFVLLIAWPLLSAILPSVPLFWPAQGTHESIEIRQTTRALVRRAKPSLQVYLVYAPLAAWVLGTFIAAAPLLLGCLRVRQLRRQATPVDLIGAGPTPGEISCDVLWRSLLDEMARTLNLKRLPQLLLFPGPVMPMTFGLLRPKILLPEECLSWTPERRRAVLLHELAHVKRRDVAAQFLTQLAAALWWFQPLSWFSRRSLRLESERACDELVVQSGIKASDYAAELLAIAQGLRAQGRWAAGAAASPAVTMLRHEDLEQRLRSILSSNPLPRSIGPSRLLAAVLSISLLTVAASAITLFPQPPAKPQPLTTQRNPLMRRTVLSGLLASAGLTAATIGGSLYDPAGAAVPNAKASIYNPDTALKLEATTSADGKFVFESLPAGQYILSVEKPGFPKLYREFSVEADATLERGLMLGTPVGHPAARPEKLRIGGEAAQANLIKKIQPLYPPSAKAARLQGTVQLETEISAEGVPQDIRVVSSPSDDLTQSALEAVRQWRYSPVLLNGDPIPVITTVIVNYTLLP